MKSLYLVALFVLLHHSTADIGDLFSWINELKKKIKDDSEKTTSSPTQKSRSLTNTDEPLGTKAPMAANMADVIKNIQEGLIAEKLARTNLQKAIEDLKKSLHNVGEMKKLQMTKCESGVLFTDYCNPPKQSCFNQKKSARFRLNFTEPPAVTVGLVHLDLSRDENSRISTTKGGDTTVTKEAVSVTFDCWGGSKCFSAGISWMACGPVML